MPNSKAVPTLGADSLDVDTRTEYFAMQLQVVPSQDVFAYRVTIGAGAPGPAQRQLTLIAGQPPAPTNYDYCAIGGASSPNAELDFTYYDGVNFVVLASEGITGPIEQTDVVLSSAVVPGTVTCTSSWPAGTPPVTANAPSGVMPAYVGLDLNGLAVSYDWFIQIHTD